LSEKIETFFAVLKIENNIRKDYFMRIHGNPIPIQILLDDPLLLWLQRLIKSCEQIAKSVLSKIFYMGYRSLSYRLANERKNTLLHQKKAYEIPCTNRHGVGLDALYIPSQSLLKTGHVIVLALNTSYQDHAPKYYEPFLDRGADVVVWNPTSLTPRQYEEDLIAVLQKLRSLNPHQKIVIKSYCASSDPSISAAAALDDENIDLIIDRGHGNAGKLARSFTNLVDHPLWKKVIDQHFSCRGEEKISLVKGTILFISSEGDQLMNCQEENLTHRLYQLRQIAGKSRDIFFKIFQGDHWTLWDAAVYNFVLQFLSSHAIISHSYTQVQENDFPTRHASFYKRSILPLFMKIGC
jgi:hypothetical protein